jgi:hypothetical protein
MSVCPCNQSQSDTRERQAYLEDDLAKKKKAFASVKADGSERTLLVTANPDVAVAVTHAPLRIVVFVKGVETMAGLRCTS